MDNFKVYGIVPAKGGLSYRDYPNPYGLRAYQMKDGTYGGEMLPKSVGWLGELPGMGNLKGSTVTELSLEDEKGSFPAVVPTLDEYEREEVRKGNVTPSIYKKAREWRDLMLNQNQSPFYNEFN
jgi:hypothetical protein